MYSSLFRELHASRLQLDMTSAEEREMTAGEPDDDGTNDVIRGNDVDVGDQHAIFESQPELMNDQYLASLGNNMAPCASIFQMPEMLGSYYGSNLSNASPGGAFVSRFVTNDGMFGIPYVLRSIGQTELVGCPGLAMAAAVVLPEAFDMTSSITSQLQLQLQHQHQQQQQQQQHQHQPSVVDAQQQIQTTAIPSSLLGFAVIAADASGVISVPSSSSSSSPSSSSLSVMSASGAGAGGGGCGESAEDATTAAAEAGADDDPGCCGSSSSKASSSRESPHSGIFSNRRCSDEGVPPPTTTTAGGPPSLTEGGGPLDRSTPPPERDLLLHGGGPPVTLDHRRNSLELGCGSRELADGLGHLSQAGVTAGGGGAADVPAHLRRASIPCMSVSAARGLARGSVAAAHLAHRPSVPLDYESLKVKLEELTGTVTDGKRAKETTGGDRSRRTSLVSLTHPPPAASGSSSTMTPHPEVDRLTPTLTSSTTAVAGEGTAAGSHASMRNNGFTGVASYAVAEADEKTEYCLQSTCALQSQEPIDAIIAQNAKTLQNPTEDSSSSSSSSSSLSSLSSSSSWDKFRLQYIIEHVLQYDVRLQEILKRHELEMAAIQLKHRFQWMELEKLLTQRLGDQWRKFITIPALSVPPEGLSTSPWRYPAPVEGLDKTLGQVPRDEPPGSSICVQNPFDPLQTIKEGQADEDQLDSNAIRIYQQQTTTATTMQNALQQNGRPVGDVAKSSAITDHAGRRCSTTDACVDTPQRPRAISLSNVFLVGDKATTNGDKAESRICQNIASSLARRQSSVAIMNPNSSRLHRHTTTSKEVAPCTRPADISTRPDSSASTRSDPSASIRPDSSASSSRPSTPQGDYRQLLLLAQMLQNQTYNSRMAQPFLPNFLPTFPAVPFQTTNFAASYGCDPASMMALNGGILPMEMMGSENGIELNGFRQTQAPHVEIQPPWTNGHQLSASKNCSLQATGEETSRGLPVGYAQPMNGYPGLPHEVPGIGHTGQTMQGYPLFPGLLPSHLASCQLPSMAQNPWLLRTGGTMGVDCPMSFVTPSSSSLGFPYTMVATNPAFYSLVKDYNSEHM